MNHHSEPTDVKSSATGVPATPESLATHAADRRRLLLKGVGRGSALLGAAVPLKTLAGQRVITADSTQCSVSGMQSGIHSVSTSNPICNGYSTSTWGKSVGNFGLTPAKQWPTPTGITYSTSCKTVFARCTLVDRANQPLSLFAVVNQYPTSADAHWVCAWLNSMNPASMNFPYSTQAVLEMYKASNPDALVFFTKYMERI